MKGLHTALCGKGLLGRVWASGGLQKQQGESEESFVRRNSPAFMDMEPRSDLHLKSSTRVYLVVKLGLILSLTDLIEPWCPSRRDTLHLMVVNGCKYGVML